MTTKINEMIQVGAIFGDNKKKLKPVWFIWGGRRYNIKEITYIWTESMGKAVVHHFTVKDGTNLSSISYNTDTLVCTLHSMHVEG